MKTLLTLTLALFFASCDEFIDFPSDDENLGGSEFVEFEVLENTQLSGFQSVKYTVVNDKRTYEELFTQHLSYSDDTSIMIPEVDFSDYSVVFLFKGEHSHMVSIPEIHKVEFKNDKIYIHQKVPASEMTLPAFSYPATIIKIEKTDLSDIDFVNL